MHIIYSEKIVETSRSDLKMVQIALQILEHHNILIELLKYTDYLNAMSRGRKTQLQKPKCSQTDVQIPPTTLTKIINLHIKSWNTDDIQLKNFRNTRYANCKSGQRDMSTELVASVCCKQNRLQTSWTIFSW